MAVDNSDSQEQWFALKKKKMASTRVSRSWEYTGEDGDGGAHQQPAEQQAREAGTASDTWH